MMETVKKYGVAVLVVASFVGAMYGWKSYQHFTWVHVQIDAAGHVAAVPAWKK